MGNAKNGKYGQTSDDQEIPNSSVCIAHAFICLLPLGCKATKISAGEPPHLIGEQIYGDA